MAISEKAPRIIAARNKIRTKLLSFGLGSSTDKIDASATVIDNISNRGAVDVQIMEGQTYTVPAGYHNGGGKVVGIPGGGNYSLQSKTVTPEDTALTVTPDSGFYGLSSVLVEAGGGGAKVASGSFTPTAGDVDKYVSKTLRSGPISITGLGFQPSRVLVWSTAAINRISGRSDATIFFMDSEVNSCIGGYAEDVDQDGYYDSHTISSIGTSDLTPLSTYNKYPYRMTFDSNGFTLCKSNWPLVTAEYKWLAIG